MAYKLIQITDVSQYVVLFTGTWSMTTSRPSEVGCGHVTSSGQGDACGSDMYHPQAETFSCWCSTLQPSLSLPEQITQTLGETAVA